MKKWLLHKLISLLVAELEPPTEWTVEERATIYAELGENIEFMKLLDTMLVADTKEMIGKDALRGKEAIWMRYGMFIRTKALRDKASKSFNDKQEKSKLFTK